MQWAAAGFEEYSKEDLTIVSSPESRSSPGYPLLTAEESLRRGRLGPQRADLYGVLLASVQTPLVRMEPCWLPTLALPTMLLEQSASIPNVLLALAALPVTALPNATKNPARPFELAVLPIADPWVTKMRPTDSGSRRSLAPSPPRFR